MGRSGEQPLIYLSELASAVLGTVADLELSIASLKSSHTGQNLACQLYDVLKAFGLLRFVSHLSHLLFIILTENQILASSSLLSSIMPQIVIHSSRPSTACTPTFPECFAAYVAGHM